MRFQYHKHSPYFYHFFLIVQNTYIYIFALFIFPLQILKPSASPAPFRPFHP